MLELLFDYVDETMQYTLALTSSRCRALSGRRMFLELAEVSMIEDAGETLECNCARTALSRPNMFGASMHADA